MVEMMKVGPRVLQRDQTDDEADRHRDQPGEREGDERRDAEIGEEDRRRIAADREEDVVAERDVAGIAADDVPARGDGDVHVDEEQHVQPVVHAADRELQRAGRPQRREQQARDQRAACGCGAGFATAKSGQRRRVAISELRPLAEQALRPDQQDHEQREIEGHRRPGRAELALTKAAITESASAPISAPSRLPMPPSTTSDRRIATHSQCLLG